MRQGNRIKQLGWGIAVIFLMASVGQAVETARLLTNDKVNVYREGNLVQVLTENAPLPEGALLKPEGDCGVRMAYMSLVAKAGSAFGVRQDGASVALRVDAGTVYFAATSGIQGFEIVTPPGAIITRQVILNADTGEVLKGFVTVADDKATLGVLEGGKLVVSTAEGEQVIQAGEQIVLAKAGGASSSAAALTGGKISKGALAAGLAAGAAAGVFLVADDDDDQPSPTSPAAP
jgi:hypothetical protein